MLAQKTQKRQVGTRLLLGREAVLTGLQAFGQLNIVNVLPCNPSETGQIFQKESKE